ncbi:hypothetical protein AWB75_03256 [Caballeronia catudaia]|uniref:Lipoprotein n=1 Tax=Caballeronia catudaia TaxID=1777136 RepID=A0A158BCQ0_9BURK|nr:hypothetical protein [Caballeronia catudaia]SAK67660.1 hypothetical protein AWB75_03256 [Caballeronia catudaia]
MRMTLVLATTAAALFAMSALAQDAPAPSGTAQQGAVSTTTDSSYGGTMSTTKASGAARDAWTSTSQLCTPGLSCNIYSGQ